MNRLLWIPMVLILLIRGGSAFGVEIAGVVVPDKIVSGSQGHGLVLNGAGIRKKFFVKVYIGSLYLSSKANDVQSVLEMEGAKTVTMHFLHSKVSKEKIVEGWTSGFSKNLSTAEFDSLHPRLEQFNGLFQTVQRGDRIRLDYIPAQGTEVRVNEEHRGTIPGQDFFRALLKVWLGPHPADRDLKDAMLGRH